MGLFIILILCFVAISSCSAATTHIINDTNTNDEIQTVINNAQSGDTINFTNTGSGEYNNIALIINKTLNITSDGNVVIKAINTNASIPRLNLSSMNPGGLNVNYAAAFYFIAGSSYSNINNLKIIGDTSNGFKFSCLIYVPIQANASNAVIGLNIENNNLDGAYYGIFIDQRNNYPVISGNTVSNMKDMGIFLFGAGNGIIKNNNIYNITRHGIGVRHGSGNNAEIFNNTIIGANEGIYLMHSNGHIVYNNTINNTTLSSITAYGATNTAIYDNNINGQIGIYLGGGFTNITLTNNNFKWTNPSTTPSFATNLVIGDAAYSGNPNGIFSDSLKIPTDLIITSSIDKTTVINGETVTYIIKVTNNGTGTARNITLKDIIPSGLSLDNYYASRGTFSNGVWTIAELQNGDAVLILTLKVNSANTYNSQINMNYIDNTYSNATNNSYNKTHSLPTLTATPKLTATPNIELTNSVKVSSTKVKKGKTVVIKVTITNTGLDNSNIVSVFNKLPKNLKNIKVNNQALFKSNKWNIVVNGKSSITLTMTVKVNKKGSYSVPISVDGVKIKTITIKGV